MEISYLIYSEVKWNSPFNIIVGDHQDILFHLIKIILNYLYGLLFMVYCYLSFLWLIYDGEMATALIHQRGDSLQKNVRVVDFHLLIILMVFLRVKYSFIRLKVHLRLRVTKRSFL